MHFLGKRSKELSGQASNGEDQRPETVRIDVARTGERQPEPEGVLGGEHRRTAACPSGSSKMVEAYWEAK